MIISFYKKITKEIQLTYSPQVIFPFVNQTSLMALNSLQKSLLEITWYSRSSSLILNANSQSSNYIVKITKKTAQKYYVEILHDVTTSRTKSTFFWHMYYSAAIFLRNDRNKMDP